MAKHNKGTNAPYKRKGLTPKEKKFCREYVTLRNGAEAVRRSYDLSDKSKTNGTARVMATEMLRKPHIRNEIETLMFKAGLEIQDVVQVHKRNMVQDKDFSTSQRAVSDFYKVTGMMDSKPEKEMKVAFIIEK
jgi:phage terminase small subunit